MEVYDASTKETVCVDVKRVTADSVTVTFAVAPAAGKEYKIVIVC